MDSIDTFNKLNKSEFLSIFGNVFEKTEWIAEKCYDLKPYKSVDELFLKIYITNCGQKATPKIISMAITLHFFVQIWLNIL